LSKANPSVFELWEEDSARLLEASKFVDSVFRLEAFEPTHALRATAATNALDHYADITKVQEWLGHANIAATRIYDRRRVTVEDSPTFKVTYCRPPPKSAS